MNGDSSHADDTSPVELTKKLIRSGIWKRVRKNKSANVRYNYYNCIPWFTDADDPVTNLRELDAFKNAKGVLVGYDKAQESVKLACLRAKKTLYVQVPYLQKYLMTRLKLDDEATDATYREALTLKGLEKYGEVIGLEDKPELDLVILGSVAVSEEGVRIGRGGGYSDLYLAVLIHTGTLRPETKVITTVHDSQIVDSIPAGIVGVHDFPVDMIVTPSRVINVDCQRPSGIIWSLLSPSKLKFNQLVSQLREKEIENGQTCDLKVESDSERNKVNGGGFRRYYRGRWANNRRWQKPRYRKQTNGIHSESEQYEVFDGESADPNGKRGRIPRKTYFYRRTRPVTTKIADSGKGLYRDKVWQQLRKNNAVTTSRQPYNRIPGFKGVQESNQSFRSLEVFKNAKNVLLNTDKLHEGLRLMCLEDGKGLYLLNQKPQKQLLIRVNVPEGEKPDLQMVVRSGLETYGEKLDSLDGVHIDVWVVGSVAISKNGQHIGKGNGLIDLCYAYLMEKNIIDSNTAIVTIVHDQQIFDVLPEDLFSGYDIPIDIIITPTQVISIKNESKDRKIQWNMISSKKLHHLPFIAEFRKTEVANGKPCELKADSSDDSENKKKKERPIKSNDQSESEQNEVAEGDSENRNRKKRFGRQFRRFHKRRNNDIGENEAGAESGNISPDSTTRYRRRLPFHRPMPPLDFSIKLTSIDRVVRVRDLKSALNERNVKPSFITWKGFKGYCYLHFAKATSPTSEKENETNPDSILSALAELTLQPTSDVSEDCAQELPPNKVSVELVKPHTRIETADETAV